MLKNLPDRLKIMTAANQIIVSCPEDRPSLQESAEHLSRSMGLPFVLLPRDQTTMPLVLYLSEKGLELRIIDRQTGHQSSLHVSFISGRAGYRLRHNLNIRLPLARAVGIKSGFRPVVVDATAGMGVDGLTLACLGCKVTMIERSPIIGSLLEDGLLRAEQDNFFRPIIKNVDLQINDAIEYMTTLDRKPFTVYLDPMYPHREKSALNKIEMRTIRRLVGDDSDSLSLFETALKMASNRVVVKRPKSAPSIGDKTPNHTVMMKNGRFDIYFIT